MTAEKILLVDDEEGIRKVLGISLSDIGYHVLTAENGEKALSIFKEFSPTVVLTDIKMPGIDGIELLQKIKTEKPDTEVIMITGHGDMNLAIESLKHEATDFITKPINQDALEIALKRAHEKISMRQRLKAYTENLETLVQEKSARLVELERQTAVGQTVEGLTSAIRNIAGDLDGGITHLNEMPCFVSIHNRDLKVVATNQLYIDRLGNHVGDDCWEIYSGETARQAKCPTAETIASGTGLRRKETVRYIDGTESPVIVYTAPIRNRDGEVELVVEISADISEVDRLQEELRTTRQRYKELTNEYQLLFDQVPCGILLIDKAFRIVKTNKQLREMLGNLEGRHCYESLKGFEHKCSECTAHQTFQDGQIHTGHHIWKSKEGKTVHTHVITVPLRMMDGSFNMVMEMAVDVTQTLALEDGLRFAHTFLENMITTSIDGIFAVNNSGEVTIFNPAARNLFNVHNNTVTGKELSVMLPEGFLDKVSKGPAHVYLPETTAQTIDGETLPVRLIGNRLMDGGKPMGMAFTVQDLREIKRLEGEKLEAERLAAVGQTVAGLAHGIKNLITALEGGMYMLNSGLSKSRIDRIQKGMEMLRRNIERISIFVKAFLGFSKGREIRVKLSSPAEIAREVVDLYSVNARKLGIELRNDIQDGIAPAPIDYESMHECLTNLVGNAIDACQLSEKDGGSQVTVRTLEKDGAIVYEVVDDGSGMDYEIKKKIFTTFFTTKGLGGSGLGLLMTKKIIQEHGGTINLETAPGQGSTFRITLPRNRLPKTINNETETTDR